MLSFKSSKKSKISMSKHKEEENITEMKGEYMSDL